MTTNRRSIRIAQTREAILDGAGASVRAPRLVMTPERRIELLARRWLELSLRNRGARGARHPD